MKIQDMSVLLVKDVVGVPRTQDELGVVAVPVHDAGILCNGDPVTDVEDEFKLMTISLDFHGTTYHFLAEACPDVSGAVMEVGSVVIDPV